MTELSVVEEARQRAEQTLRTYQSGNAPQHERQLARDVIALSDALSVAVRRVETLEAALKGARTALRNAQTEATHGLTASPSFIDQCIDAAAGALDDVLTPVKGSDPCGSLGEAESE